MNTSDPKLYREMSEPFATQDAATKAWQAFSDELGELRKKHKMTDVITVAGFSFLTSDGEESQAVIHCGFGNSMNQEAMTAYVLGTIQAERQQRIGELLAKGLKTKRG